jgi:hypothetical protein
MPACPCTMKEAIEVNGRWLYVRDLGPVETVS